MVTRLWRSPCPPWSSQAISSAAWRAPAISRPIPNTWKDSASDRHRDSGHGAADCPAGSGRSACFLARRTAGGPQAALALFERGVVRLSFDLQQNFASVASLIERYANVPMSLADGCLVCMSELLTDCAVFSLDGDFRIYRRHKRQKIP